MGHPAGLPDLFLDRSLGRKRVPALLRAAGLRLVTLAEHYGVPQDERILDVAWLAEAGARGWVVLMKDKQIRFNATERATVMAYGVRCFCLTRQDLRSDDMAAWFLRHLSAMEEACRDPGPFIYAVQEKRIVRMP